MTLRIPFPIHPLLDWRFAGSWRAVAIRHGLQLNVHPNDLYEIEGILCARPDATHPGHDGHAVDFLIPDGTSILACMDGEIVGLKDDGFLYGSPNDRDSRISEHLNFITLKHPPAPGLPLGFTTRYCHVARGSVRCLGLRRGDRVRKGQQIGIVGKNGLTMGDHLRVMAYHFPPEASRHESLPIQWG